MQESNSTQLVQQALLNRKILTSGQAAEAIERSWRRCLNQGLTPDAPQTPVVMTAQDLALRQQNNQFLITHAEPEMATLSEQIAHTRSMVILTDSDGVILCTMGDQSFINDEQRIALSPGASWNEAHRGTNAIGTALVEQSAISVQGAEHFMTHHHALSCSAVPIFGAKNELLATLDVTNDFNIPQQHTLALVKMAAQMIENRLFQASYSNASIVVHFHARPEFIGTLWEGIAIFDDAGQLIATNRSGQFQMQLQPEYFQQGTIHFNQLFDDTLQQLKIRSDGHEKSVIFQTRLMNGAKTFARIAFLNRQQTVRATSIPSPNRTSAANLELLDNGDVQIKQAIRQIKQVLEKNIPILIQGETGVGKDIFARAIHDASPRQSSPWVAVNCAALPEGLIEAELFGYEEGAFTGARKKGSPGKLVQASGGTLFLDEIGDMPLSLQARLLRVLQERSVTPLGSTQSIKVDFALISATNQKLKEKVDRGEFRSDLYYRLNGLSIKLPALRERTDLNALIRVILEVEKVGNIKLSQELMALFAAHPWPGNIRQLHNVLRTAIALSDGKTLTPQDLTQDFIEEFNTKISPNSAQSNRPEAPATLADMNAEMIRKTLANQQGNISAAARALGLSRNTLYKKLREMGLA